MPHQPSRSAVHVDQVLTNISVAYMQEATNFGAGMAAPTVSVTKQSDLFFKYNKGDFFRDEMQKRAPATESAGSGWNMTTDSYFAHVWALHKDIPDQIRANADAPINLERETTLFLTQKAMIRREKIFVDQFMTTGVWTATGSDTSPGTKWDQANSTPIKDLRTAMTAVQRTTGFRPNRITMGQMVWDAVADNADFIDRVNAGQTPGGPAVVQASTLAAILGIQQISVIGGVEATSQEGEATDVLNFIGGGDTGVLVSYASPTPGLMMPSSIYTFAWTGHLGANAEGGVIKTFRMDPIEADRVEIQIALDMKLIAADMGYYIPNVLNAV